MKTDGWEEQDPKSPDLTPLDFRLWGYLKDHVYSQQLTTLQQLRDAIQDELEAIPPIMVHNDTLHEVDMAKELVCINELQLGIFR